MELKAWIQMGVERRETIIELTDEDLEIGKKSVDEDPNRTMDDLFNNYVLDWAFAQFSFGWSGGGFNEECFNEGLDMGCYAAFWRTQVSSIPNTRAIRLDCPTCRSNGL